MLSLYHMRIAPCYVKAFSSNKIKLISEVKLNNSLVFSQSVKFVSSTSSISQQNLSFDQSQKKSPFSHYKEFFEALLDDNKMLKRMRTGHLEKSPDILKDFQIETVNDIINFPIAHFPERNALGRYVEGITTSEGKQPAHYEWMTYGELGQQINQFKKVLLRYGIERDNKVAIISNNRIEWVIALYAVNSLGAQLVPMYEAQLEGDWRYIIEDCNAKLILVGPEKIYEKLKSYIGSVGNVQAIISFDGSEEFLHSFKRNMKLVENDKDAPPVKVTGDSHSVLIYTSGTTGKPKGVILSHRNIASNVSGIREVWKDELFRHTSLAFLPWAHVFGQVAELQCLMAMGGSVAIISQRDQIMESLPIVKPTMLQAVPMLFNKIYDGVQKKMSNQSKITQQLFHWALSVSRRRNKLLEFHHHVPVLLRLQFHLADALVLKKVRNLFGGNLAVMPSGGAGVPVKVVEFFEDIGIPICEGYGLTETSPVITAGSMFWSNRRLGTVGIPLPNLELRILDTNPDRKAFLGNDEEGEVVVSGPNVMVGYHFSEQRRKSNEVDTANNEVFEYFDGKRFFHTGDLGKMVEGKYLKITGRIKEQYKLENGKYVVPVPLEDIISRSNFIAQAMIYGDNKPFNIVLLVLDIAEVKTWLKKHKGATLEETDNSIAANPHILADVRVIKLITEELNQVCAQMKGYEKPSRFAFLDDMFSVENQLLTLKLSLRRKNVIARYKALIDGLYDGTSGHSLAKVGTAVEV